LRRVVGFTLRRPARFYFNSSAKLANQNPQIMTPAEAELSESSRVLDDALAAISEEEAACRPDPLRWSVRDCVEHLALAERGMLKRIASSAPAEPLPADPAREPRLIASMVNRAVLRDSPAPVQPTGRFSTLAEAREQFKGARRDTILFVQANQGDLGLRTVVHPFFGPITGTEMLHVMSGHVRRHADQIREIRRAKSQEIT
jgi:hypothetical protein